MARPGQPHRPPQRLTALLPDTASWVPPRPGNVTADAADASVTVTWDHPGAGDHFLVDTYTINYRPADQTGDHTQQAAAESPVTITGLANGTEYAIFVTATNTQGTSNPSLTVAATPSATAQARTHDHTGAYSDSDDIAASAHEDAINALAGWHIFDRTDCSMNPLKFCPDSALPRWKLAVWLVRALDRLNADPDNNLNTFNDVNKRKWYKPFVERLRVLGVTTGCVRRSTIFCPNDTVTRAEMAVFLVRAFNIPSAGDAGFTDIDRGYWANGAINAIAAAGITQGCTPTTFCPEANTTNAEMAAFIHRACTNLNRDCSPTDIENGSTGGGGGGTTPGSDPPEAPTMVRAVPGPGTLHITWTPNGPAATQWKIGAYRVGRQGIGTSPDNDDSPITADPAAGHTITGLAFNTEYLVTIQGINQHGTGTAGTARETTGRAAVELVALEVTQGLQDWYGSLDLVKGKKTVVRAFLEPGNGLAENSRVTLQLLGADGRVLATETPVNANLTPPNTHPSNLSNFRTQADPAGRRADLNASANFVLTDPAWIGNPNDSGPAITKRYKLTVTNKTIDCQEPVTPAEPCQANIDFQHVKIPRARMISVGTMAGPTMIFVGPTPEEIDEQQIRLRSLFPVPDFEFEDDTVIVPSSSLLTAVLARLETIRLVDGVQNSVPYLGVLSGYTAGDSLGLSRRGEGVAAWYLEETAAADSLGYARNVGSHEFGHLLELAHAAYSRTVGSGGAARTEFVTYCTTDAIIAASLLPMEYPMASVETVTGVPHAMLGPMGQRDREVWGLDTSFIEGPRAAAVPAADVSSLAVLNPNEVFSVMSYCGFPRSVSQELWVDKHFHGMFINKINNRDWPLPYPSGHGARDGAASDTAVISGYRRIPAAGAAAEATLLPVQEFRTVGVVEPSEGDHLLELLDGNGAVLRSIRFSASVTDGTAGDDGDPRGLSDDHEYWVVPVVDAPEYASYRITSGSETIAQQARTASAPAVEVTSPTSGSVFSSDDVTFRWSGSDSDGDPLTYTVQYSPDGGATFETLSLSQASSSLTVARDRLTGSTQAKIRVIASDGTRSTTADSGVFTVAESPPRVNIRHPHGGAVFGGYNRIALDAAAHDSEDGELDASSITWSSSIDGQLATSGYAWVSTDDLTAGTHMLTATATDSSSMTGSAAVTITVNATNDAPAAGADTAYAAVSRRVLIDVIANDSDTESDINPHSLAVVVPPSQGSAAVGRDPRRGAAVVEYTATAAGIDALIYRVCDRFHQCDTAEVTIVAEGV